MKELITYAKNGAHRTATGFKLVLFFIATVGVFFTSCQKDEFKDAGSQSDIKALSQPDILITDGYLHLRNWEVADSLTKLVSGMSDAEANAWEQSIGFESARSLENKLFGEYEKIETIEGMQNFKSKYSSILQFSEDEDDNGFELKAGSTIYDQIISSFGKLRVGNVLYSKSEKGLKISFVKGDVIKEIPFTISNESNLKSHIIYDPRFTTLDLYESIWYYDGDRRMKVRVLIFPEVDEPFKGSYPTVWDVNFVYRLRMSGSKNATFGGWSDYRANMELVNPTCYLQGQAYNKRYEGSKVSNDHNNVYVDFAYAYGGRYVDGAYSSLLSVTVPSCSFKADGIASSGVALSKGYKFEYSGTGWSANTVPWTDFSFSY